MKISKEEFRNMFISDFILWGMIMMVLKLYNPKLAYLSELASAIAERNIVVVFYICGILFFILISYVLFICGMYVVYDETIGKFVREVKAFLGKYQYEGYDYGYTESSYNGNDILVIAVCIFAVLPIMLYFVIPALTAVLFGIFILYCVLASFS